MGPIAKHSVMTKVGAHVCGCKVASLNARDKCYFFARWHQVAFVKRQGPLYAPPGAVAAMVLGWTWVSERGAWMTITNWKCIAKTHGAMRNFMGPTACKRRRLAGGGAQGLHPTTTDAALVGDGGAAPPCMAPGICKGMAIVHGRHRSYWHAPMSPSSNDQQ